MRRTLPLLWMLTAAAAAQIGGYFELGPTPSQIREGDSFDVTVRLEMPAREETSLSVTGFNLVFSPSVVVIPKGSRVAVFRATAPLLPPVPVGTAPATIPAQLVVSSSKTKVARDLIVFPRSAWMPPPAP
ncbi:MAG: hypothetical protein AB1758_31080 [Candidatus Eremiobacterota bacterium]